MTEIPIVVSTNEVTVGGMVDRIDLQVGVGQQGPRGSRIFSGDVSPLTLPINSPFFAGYTEFIYGDMYIQRSASNIAVWEWKNQPGGDTWVKTSDIAVAGGGGITSLDPDLTAIADLTGTSGLLRKSGINTWVLDTNTYLTSNQTVTLTGDATGSGSISIPVTVVDDSHSHTGSTISALDAGDTTTGIFNIARIPTGTTGTTVALGNHTHSYQPVDGDLTAIAAVSGTGYLRRTGVDTWVLDTPATATWGSISGALSSQTDLQSALNGKQAADNDLTAIAALAGTSGFLKKTATDTWALDTSTYLTSNQTITLSGDASGTGTTAITVTIADDSHAHTGSTISALDASDTTTGTFDIARIPTGTTGTTVALGNHTHSYQPLDADLTAIAGLVGTSGFLKKTAADTWTLDTTAYTTNTGTVTSVAMTVPTGLSISGTPITTSGTLALTLTAGYSIPTTASQTNWDSAYTDRMKWDGSTAGLTASTGRTSLGATTVGSNLFTLVNPTAVTFLRVNADNTVSTLDAATFRSAIGAGTSSTTGTVTSVAMTVPTGLSISGSPISTSGTLALTLTSGYEIPTTAALAAKAPLAGPTFTGTPSAPTAAVDTSTTQLATTAYVINQGYLKSSTASSTYLPLSGGTLTGGNVVDTVLTIKNGASTNTELRLEHPYGMNASTLGFGDNTKREANISLYNTGLNFALTMDGSTITSSLIMYDGAAIVGGSAGSTPIGLSASTLHLWANQINATGKVTIGSAASTAGLELGDSGPRIMTGTASPEGSVAAPVGSEVINTSDGSKYDKISGTGNTGWSLRVNGAGYIEDAQAMMMMGVL